MHQTAHPPCVHRPLGQVVARGGALVRVGLIAVAAGILGVGCSADPKATNDSGVTWEPQEWTDTGISDATWEAAEADESTASGAAADHHYDGLRPVHPDISSDADDDAYRPGEVVHVAFDLENGGDADYPHHPGLVLTTDHPDVEIPDAIQWVESLPAGAHAPMAWWAVVGPMVGSGESIRFTATVTAQGCEGATEGCPVAHSASILVVVD